MMSNQPPNDYRRITASVRAGNLSPMDALDIAVTARLGGQPIRKLEAWADRRVDRVRANGGNPLLCKRTSR